MKIQKIIAAAVAFACLFSFAGCGDKSVNITIGEDGVGELITPAEGDEDYDLGSYRYSGNGIKLYYDEDVSPQLMLALEKYFLSFQNKDFTAFKESLYPDYAQRYDEYLQEYYQYGLDKSFELNCDSIRTLMLREETGEYDLEDYDGDYTGDFTITRIRGERSTLEEDETEEDLIKDFFGFMDEAFETDYYAQVTNDIDKFEYLSFFIIAEGEDGEEHLIISDYDIIFAEKNGAYYAFG